MKGTSISGRTGIRVADEGPDGRRTAPRRAKGGRRDRERAWSASIAVATSSAAASGIAVAARLSMSSRAPGISRASASPLPMGKNGSRRRTIAQMAVQHSSAVRELIEAIWATADAHDGDQMAELHADDPNLVFVVAAPSEPWHGLAEVKDAIRAAHDGSSSDGFAIERCTAFEDGNTGWGVGDGFLTYEGRRYPFRLTVVARRTDAGAWRSIFSQAAIPIRDEAFSEALAMPEPH